VSDEGKDEAKGSLAPLFRNEARRNFREKKDGIKDGRPRVRGKGSMEVDIKHR
jgi:hypothetical protein